MNYNEDINRIATMIARAIKTDSTSLSPDEPRGLFEAFELNEEIIVDAVEHAEPDFASVSDVETFLKEIMAYKAGNCGDPRKIYVDNAERLHLGSGRLCTVEEALELGFSKHEINQAYNNAYLRVADAFAQSKAVTQDTLANCIAQVSKNDEFALYGTYLEGYTKDNLQKEKAQFGKQLIDYECGRLCNDPKELFVNSRGMLCAGPEHEITPFIALYLGFDKEDIDGAFKTYKEIEEYLCRGVVSEETDDDISIPDEICNEVIGEAEDLAKRITCQWFVKEDNCAE